MSREYYHNKGEEDYAEGRYEPPNTILQEFLTWGESGTRRIAEENGAYEEGYGNAKRQEGR